MNAVELVLPLVQATPIRILLRRPENTNMNVRAVCLGDAHLAKEMETVCGIGHAHGFEVGRGEAGEFVVGEGVHGAEVFELVF